MHRALSVFAYATVAAASPAFGAAGHQHNHMPDVVTHAEPGTRASHGHEAADMKGMLGDYAMTREASGTSWQPQSSPMDGIHAKHGVWNTMTHGFANVIYDKQQGPRGDSKLFASSMLMVMGQREAGPGTAGLRGMFSLDPLTMGKRGYPLLFQTGETSDGREPLIDRQHPHDLFMELSASYSQRVGTNASVFVYAGLPGEPALGPPTFMHRFSGIDNPEAPLGHHWLDSTHISFGVVTAGYIWNGFKLEASLFNGREPDQHRYDVELRKLDSSSVRVSYNPTENLALQLSYGRLKSPERLEPEVDVDRTTLSVIYNRRFNGGNWQTTFAWGHNAKQPGRSTHAYLLESAFGFSPGHTIFGRAEHVDKDELFHHGGPLAGRTFSVKKLSLGYVYDFAVVGHAKLGLGAVVSKHFVADALTAVYGNDPASYMLFARVKLQ